MEFIRKLINLKIIFPAVVGGLTGAGASGLVESIVVTLQTGYERWTLPFAALSYYGILGVVIGIIIAYVIVFLTIVSSVRSNRKTIFNISFSAAVAFSIVGIISETLAYKLSIAPNSIAGFIILSIMVIAAYWLIFIFSKSIFSVVRRFSKRRYLTILILYLIFWVFSGVIYTISPPKTYFNKPYDSSKAINVKDKPNVFIILVDALRRNWISPYGYDINTPAMQNLADDGILFTNAISSSYWTQPSIASIFTSLLPKAHGVLRHENPLPRDIPILSDELSDAGYYSVGFSTNFNIREDTGFNRGFNEFRFLGDVKANPFDADAPRLYQFSAVEFIVRNIFPPIKRKLRAYTTADKTTDTAIDWLKRNGGRKFFMYLHYMDPHEPYYFHPYNGKFVSPFKNGWGENKYQLYSSVYQSEVEYTDSQLGRFLDYLKSSGLYKSSFILFTADHGEEFFDHYGWGHNFSMFDELIHIPFIIKLPYMEKAGTIDSSLVTQIDYAPTILSYVGVQYPKSWDGLDIFASDFNHKCIISQGLGISSVRTLKYKLIETVPDYCNLMINQMGLNGIDKRAIFPDENFFDLIADPGEKINLYGKLDYKALADSMKSLELKTLSTMAAERKIENTINLDKNTIEQLKALGYLQ